MLPPVARQHTVAVAAFGHPFAPGPQGQMGRYAPVPGIVVLCPHGHGGDARGRVRQRPLQRTRLQRDQKSRFSLTLARFPIRSRR